MIHASAMPTQFDVLIRHGRVVDPANDLDAVVDVAIDGGRIAAVAADLPGRAADTIDARGRVVAPGLIDFHCHTFAGLSAYSIELDRAGVRAGVTHVNDMGTTGWMTVPAYRELVAAPAQTPATCFPHVYALGTPDTWCRLDEFNDLAERSIRLDNIVEIARSNPGLVRGLKVHLEQGFMSRLGDPWRAFAVAREAADALAINLYLHLGQLWPTAPGSAAPHPDELPLMAVGKLKPGEVLGHCFTQQPGGLVRADGTVSPAAFEATVRGVLHEVGHGINFSFQRARAFLDAGLRPDIISSDVHGALHGGRPHPRLGLEPDIAAWDMSWSMVGTMSKVLALGVSLPDVIRASTITPARALGVDKGTLSVGARADVTILDVLEGDTTFHDSEGAQLRAGQRLLPAITVLAGRVIRNNPASLPEFQSLL